MVRTAETKLPDPHGCRFAHQASGRHRRNPNPSQTPSFEPPALRNQWENSATHARSITGFAVQQGSWRRVAALQSLRDQVLGIYSVVPVNRKDGRRSNCRKRVDDEAAATLRVLDFLGFRLWQEAVEYLQRIGQESVQMVFAEV